MLLAREKLTVARGSLKRSWRKKPCLSRTVGCDRFGNASFLQAV